MTTAATSYCIIPNPNDSPGASAVPIGAITMWSVATAPSGWLICDGTAVSRFIYASLFAVIGTTYGSGDGSSTFNVPNFAGRLPRGVNGSYALASAGGNDTITLAANQLPNHAHTLTLSDPGHTHGSLAQGGGYTAADGGNGNRANSGGTTNTATTGITISMSDSLLVGGSQQTQTTTNIVNPYLAVPYIIKAA